MLKSDRKIDVHLVEFKHYLRLFGFFSPLLYPFERNKNLFYFWIKSSRLMDNEERLKIQKRITPNGTVIGVNRIND